MFLRLLVWLALMAAGWYVFFRKRVKGPPRAAAGPAAASAARPAAKAEPMVDCAHCGLHLPASEALLDPESRAYCCPDHRAAGPRGAR